jgi:hypothetical protein
MNAISIETGLVGSSSAISARFTRRGGARFAPRPAPEWLPAPAPVVRRRPASASRTRRSGWPTANPGLTTEKVMLTLLVVAAAVGIGYGFSCMLDLVQNWASFSTGVARLIP